MKTKELVFAFIATILFVSLTTSCSKDDDEDSTKIVSITYEATTSHPQYVGLNLSYNTGEIDATGEDVFEDATVENPTSGWSANVKMDLKKVLPSIIGNVYLNEAGIANGIRIQDITITLKIKQDGVVVAESTGNVGTQTFLTGITYN